MVLDGDGDGALQPIASWGVSEVFKLRSLGEGEGSVPARSGHGTVRLGDCTGCFHRFSEVERARRSFAVGGRRGLA